MFFVFPATARETQMLQLRGTSARGPKYQRQLMAFENVTYMDANKMCKKTYEVTEEFY